ncbi:SIS domain-containing protein [Aeoliella sp.]|uniref:SIS domain-containing protein n=1 Tax=Aeoliella sp. TaxID=2795800 RepID=UPI003CCB7A67
MSQTLGDLDHQAIDSLAGVVYAAWRKDQLVSTLGNGGSASTASHFVADLVKTAAVDGQKRLRAICLSDNIGLLTAIGNDIHYGDTFQYPLEAFARPGDTLIAISASGNSPNVVRACEFALTNGVQTVALTGFTGGAIGDMADLHVNVPSCNYGIIEDLHLAIGHMITQSLKARILSDCDSSNPAT